MRVNSNPPLTNTSPLAIVTLDRSGHVIKISNSEKSNSTPKPLKQYVGTHYSSVVPEQSQALAMAAFNKLSQGFDQTLQTSLQVVDNPKQEFQILGIPSLSKDGEVESIECTVVPVPLKGEEHLSEESFATIAVSTLSQGLLLLDAGLQVEWANDGFYQITGLAQPQIVQHSLKDVLEKVLLNATGQLEILEKLGNTHKVEAEVQLQSNSKEEKWASIEISEVAGHVSPSRRFVLSLVDVSARKKAEKGVVLLTEDLSRQNRDLQQFTYIVSHNLRAPVANALGLSNMLTKIKKEDSTFDSLLSQVKSSVFQLDTIIKDVNLILSIKDNQDMVEKEPVKLVDVCHQVISSLQESLQGCGGAVVVDAPKDYVVSAKKAYLYSIVYNLLSNAIKYRSKERSLQVVISIAAKPEGGTLVRFSDNGSGMDMDKVGADVFTLYKRFHRHTEGRGIGLFLVKTHVDSLGGQIGISSDLLHGTTFTIHLP